MLSTSSTHTRQKAAPDCPAAPHIQLANQLREDICQGRWRQEMTLPSERRLAQSLDISRRTVGLAFNLLCDWGVLTRRQGSGSYINPPGKSASLNEPKAQSKAQTWLLRESAKANHDEAFHLGLSPGAAVLRLHALQWQNGLRYALEYSTVSAQYLTEPLQVQVSAQASLMARQLGPLRTLQRIAAVNANSETAGRLRIPVGAALLHICRLSYLENGVAVVLTHVYGRGDGFECTTQLSAKV